MISIQGSISELERSYEQRTLLLGSYIQAIRSAAQYAVELDDQITAPHRRYLTELADRIGEGEPENLIESRATFRGLMRDYRDRAGRYLQELRSELARTAKALQETMDSMAQSAGDHESQVRKSIGELRELSSQIVLDEVRARLLGAASSIEVSLEEVRKEHQLTVAQFLAEIRVLHQRIDSLEAAASVDSLTGLYDRGEMEERIRAARPGSFHLVLFQVHGLRKADAQFGPSVRDELAGAFTKRLKHSLPEGSVLGRWSLEEFIALIARPRDPRTPGGQNSFDRLSGAYACVHSGKTVRPSLQVTVGIVDSVSRETSERALDRVKMFLTGA